MDVEHVKEVLTVEWSFLQGVSLRTRVSPLPSCALLSGGSALPLFVSSLAGECFDLVSPSQDLYMSGTCGGVGARMYKKSAVATICVSLRASSGSACLFDLSSLFVPRCVGILHMHECLSARACVCCCMSVGVRNSSWVYEKLKHPPMF